MHDVIVVGAGPAGNITALRLSSEGYNVVVLDWREKIGDKLCTGIVGNECIKLYTPNQTDVYREAHSAIIVSPSGKRHKIGMGKTEAYIINRVAFVSSIAQQASETGTSYRLGEKVVDIHCSKSMVTVQTLSRDTARTYKARVIVIASGFSSPLLEMVGLRKKDQPSHMIGCQTSVLSNRLEHTEVYLGDNISPGAFGWLVPLSGSKALAGLVSRQKLNGHMDNFLKILRQRGKISTVSEKPKRWGIPIKPISRTFNDRVIVIGDAAGFAKPTTGGGIYYGLLSGEIAAEIIRKALSENNLSSDRLVQYEYAWKSRFGKELKIGYYSRLLYESLGSKEIDALLNKFFSNRVKQEIMSSSELNFDWHSRLIAKVLDHRNMGEMVKSIGPVMVPLISRLTKSKSG